MGVQWKNLPDQSLRMSMQHSTDLSMHSNPNEDHNANTHNLGGTDLRLCLSLSPEPSPLTNHGINSVKDCARPLKSECLEPINEQSCGHWVTKEENHPNGIRSANGGLGRLKRVYSEGMSWEEEEEQRKEEKSLVMLQMCGSCNNSSITPKFKSPAVGWPPIRSYRKNNNAGQQRIPTYENKGTVQEEVSENFVDREGRSKFVKVIMDGMSIGRKVDLNAHNNYNTLALTLDNMFQLPTILKNAVKEKRPNSNQWRLLDPCSDYLMTYVDKEGDWMLVGDAPWGMFVNSVKRLRIAKIQKKLVLTCKP